MRLRFVLLVLLLLEIGNTCQMERFQRRLLHNLSQILTGSCASNDFSIYVSTGYRQQLKHKQERHIVDDVLDQLLQQHSDGHQMVPVLLDGALRRVLTLQIELMLFFVRNTEDFMASAMLNVGATTTHKHKYLVVLLVSEENKSPIQEMSRLFDYMLHQRYNLDVLVLHAHFQHESLEMYSFRPFGVVRGQPTCAATEPVLVAMQQAQMKQLYPVKVSNMKGCPVHVIVWNIPPYIIIHPEKGTVDGWDAELLRLLETKLNFRLSFVPNDPPELIGGESFTNGTLTGAFQMLRQRRGNITLGCTACLPARAMFLSNTGFYNLAEYVVVLRDGNAYSAYEIMLFPFTCDAWLLFLLLYVLRLVYRCLLRPGSCHLVAATVSLGWILFSYVLRIGYESSIFKFVHNAPMRPLPQTLEQALQQDYSFIMDHATYRMTAPLPALKARAHILPGIAVSMFDALLQQPADKRLAVLTSRDFMGYYLAKNPQQSHRFVVLQSKILNNMLCMHLPMGSYLTNSISAVLFNLRSFGISQQLAKRHNWSSAKARTVQRTRPLATYHQRFDESMRFIYAAVYGLLWAQILTLCVFALELMSQWSSWLRTLFHKISG